MKGKKFFGVFGTWGKMHLRRFPFSNFFPRTLSKKAIFGTDLVYSLLDQRLNLFHAHKSRNRFSPNALILLTLVFRLCYGTARNTEQILLTWIFNQIFLFFPLQINHVVFEFQMKLYQVLIFMRLKSLRVLAVCINPFCSCAFMPINWLRNALMHKIKFMRKTLRL